MADQTTLSPSTRPKREAGIPPLSQIIGGTFEAVLGNVIGIGRVPESPEAKEPVETPVPEYVRKAFSSGELTGFQNPRPLERTNAQLDAQLIERQRAELKHYDVVAAASKVVESYEARRAAENQARFELSGMSDEERAKEGNYQTGYRGESLYSIYNTVWVFMKRIAAIMGRQKKETAAAIAQTRINKSALQGIFEGASGSQGGGQANLSVQAVG